MATLKQLTTTSSKEEYILEIQDIILLTSLSWASILELISKGDFPYPAPALYNLRTIVWRYDEVMDWMSKYENT